MPERCSAKARSTAAFPVTATPQLATTAQTTIARRAGCQPRRRRCSSVFEGVEEEAGGDEQRKRDHDDERHPAEILCHVAALPRRCSFKRGRGRADRARGTAPRPIAGRPRGGSWTRWLALHRDRTRGRRPAGGLHGPAGARAYAVLL